MADRQIGELEAAVSVGVADLFVVEQSATAKKLTGQTLLNDLAAALDGHGGISDITYTDPVPPSLTGTLTITMADETTITLPVTNGNGITSITWQTSGTAGDGQLHTGTIHYTDGTTGTITIRDGYKGDTGAQTYVHIRWSEQAPQADSDLLSAPAPWIGIYAGLSADAPTSYTAYTWYEYKGTTGDTGNGIVDITRTSSSGLVDVYTVTMTDGSTYTFTVVNGNGITNITGPVSSGLQDTYTINFDSGVSQPFTVTNGDGIASIVKTSTSGLLDTYTITLTSGTTYTFQVRNAKSIVSITQISGSHAAGTTDTYQILYTDGDTSFFTVYNGANGTGAVSSVSGIQADGQGDVPQIITGNGAPTPQTVGQLNQLYFDLNDSVLYFCLGESQGSYSWAGTTVTVDSTLSTSSTNPVQNRVITGKIGTAALDTTAQNLSEAVNEVLAEIPDSTSDLTNDSGYITAAGAPVQSVNGYTGAVTVGQLMNGGGEASSYPTATGRYAVVANIFSNMSPASFWGVLTIEKYGAFQRHLFTSSQNEMWEGWRESSTVAEPPAWVKIASNQWLSIESSQSATTVASATWTTVKSITLYKGRFLIVAGANFASNPTGNRRICISTGGDNNGAGYYCYDIRRAVDGFSTNSTVSRIVNVTAAAGTTFNLNVYQNSGASLSVNWGIEYQRLD